MKAKINDLKSKVLDNLSKIMGHALNLEETLNKILEILSADLSMNRAVITVVDSHTEQLPTVVSYGLSSQQSEQSIYGLDHGGLERMFRECKPFLLQEIGSKPLFVNKKANQDINKHELWLMGTPITLNGSAVGIVSVDHVFGEEVPFEEDIRFLSIIATLIGQLVSIKRQLEQRELGLLKANEILKEQFSAKMENFFFTAKSQKILEAQQLIKKVAPTQATVLLFGPAGTGKTLVAQIIHELSPRKRYPFIKINTEACPEDLLETELFGQETGSFSRTIQTKLGRVEEANGGTIFLNEIGEISLNLQAKFLRLLQDREFERIGSTRTRRVDVRIVAATNLDLDSAVSEGFFREDLYYRLNVLPIRVPSLSERAEDIYDLIKFFCRKLEKEYGAQLRFTESALDTLSRYSWPGNIREMENLMERLAIMNEDTVIEARDLDPYISYNFNQLNSELDLIELDSLQEMEKRSVLAALERNNWVQSRAARDLGITLRQMGYRIKKFGLENCLKQKKIVA